MGLPGSPFPPMFGDSTSKSKAKVAPKPKPKTPAKPAAKPAASKSTAKPAAAKSSPAKKSSPPPPPQVPGYLSTHVNGNPSTFDAANGAALLGPLSLPQNLHADSQFTWDYQNTNSTQDLRAGGRNASQTAGFNSHQQSITTMTMAGAVSYMRQLAATDQDSYNALVHQLVAAGYLTPENARYNGYSIEAGNAFLKSAAEVWSINQDGGVNATVRWADHINSIIQGRLDAGQIDANGLPLSGSASQGPVRQDKYSDPETVKASINDAAMSVLGRHLTDAEVKSFADAFHGQEAKWNDQQWAGQQAQANGTTSTVQDAPQVSANAKNYVEGSPALGADRTNSLLGSYIGVLRNMTGLGSGGVSSAVN